MSRSSHRPRKIANQPATLVRLSIVVFGVAFVLYANTLGHEFVWDDRELIAENPTVSTLDAPTLKRIFTEEFFTTARSGSYYRPLVTLSFHIDHALFGGNPHGFHLVNVVWNAIVCVLVFLFVVLLFRNRSLALATALLFAVHPVHTENVAWIAGRTDLLATLWALVAMTLYVAGRRRHDLSGAVGFGLGSVAAFSLALLAKESVAVVPLILIVLELPPCGELLSPGPQRLPRWIHPTPYFAVLATYVAVRIQVLGTATTAFQDFAARSVHDVALWLAILGGYVVKLLLPIRLSGEWEVLPPQSFADPWVLAGLLSLAAIGTAVIRFRRKPEVVVAAAVFLFGLLPVLNIVPIGEFSAERLLYFPSIGFALALGTLFAPALAMGYRSLRTPGDPAPSMPRSLAGRLRVALVMMLLVFAARTVIRNADWRNDEVFFAATARSSPGVPRAHVNTGDVARRAGRIEEAIAAYKRALVVDPSYLPAVRNLGGMYLTTGRLDMAEPLITRAVEIAPDNPDAWAVFGMLRHRQGNLDEAARHFERALQLNPGQSVARYNLGIVRYRQGRYAAAKRHFTAVAGAGRPFPRAHYYLAAIASESGDTVIARDHARRFLATAPDDDPLRPQAQKIADGL